jgi:ABC-type tungstate transport system permease subunit
MITTIRQLDICNGGGTTRVTWTATDACGNSRTVSRTITIREDNTAPNFVNVPESLVLTCEEISETGQVTLGGWLTSVTAEDACDTDVVITHDYDNTTLDICNGGGTTRVTWTATDACGNSRTVSRTIRIIEDNTAPTLPARVANLTIPCTDMETSATTIGAWLASVTATDACDTDPVVTNDYDDFNINLCGEGSRTLVTWTAVDACGNTSTVTANLIIEGDDTAPTFVNVPDNLTLSCEEISETGQVTLGGWLTSVTAEDACDTDVVITHDYDNTTLDICNGGGTTRVTWTATDACGNSRTVSRTITIREDNTAPNFVNVPDNLVLSCDEISETGQVTLGGWLTSVTAEDACDTDVVITHDYDNTTLDICNGGGTTRVTWTATDACGNSRTVSRTITIREDNTAPNFVNVPESLTLTCEEISETSQVTLAGWLNSVTAEDACDTDVVITHDYDNTQLDICNGGGTTRVTWTATDACGNSRTVSRTITIREDNTAPNFVNVPDDLVLSCEEISETGQVTLGGWLTSVTAEDACDTDVVITHDYDNTTLDICNGGGTTRVTWTATDACGNSRTVSRTIRIIEDNTAPNFVNVPDDLTLSCDEISETGQVTLGGWLTSVTAEDACDTDVVITHDYDNTELDICNGGGTTTVTWTATDACGNSTTVSRTITIIEDNTAPNFTNVPDDLTLSCDEISETGQVTLGGWLTSVTAEDACDTDVVITHDYDNTELDICNGGGTTTVTWTATDACGNSTTVSRTITILEDNTAPNLTVPEPITIDCQDISETSSPAAKIDAWLAEAVATDNCDTDPVLMHNFDNGLLDICARVEYTITVEWTATDACGNATTLSSTILVQPDLLAPELEAPDPLVLVCGEEISAQVSAWLDDYEVSDNCNSEGLIHVENDFVALPEACEPAITVTWTARDACGNESTATSTVIVIDETAPVWTIKPADLIIECSGYDEDVNGDIYDAVEAWVRTIGGGEAVDECSIVEYKDNFDGLSDECGRTGSATVKFTAIDECGNETHEWATVQIIDTYGPTITVPAKDLTVECDGGGNLAELEAWLDNNGGADAEDKCSYIDGWTEPS